MRLRDVLADGEPQPEAASTRMSSLPSAPWCSCRSRGEAVDPIVFAAMSVVMLGVGALASYMPARQASSGEPHRVIAKRLTCR